MSPRYIYRLIQAFFKRFKAIVFVGIFVGILFFIGLYFILPNITSENQTIGIVGRFTTDNMPDEISLKLSRGLTKVDKDGNTIPAIAKSWESTDDGKTWTFSIQENLLWSDGKKITSKDISYTFSDATVDIIDEKTIKFNLSSPFSAFPVILSKPLFKKGLVGIGEWEVSNISLSGGYIQKISIKNKNRNRITYKFYPSDARLKLALKLGAVDTIEKIEDPTEFHEWKTIKLEKVIGYNNFVGIFFNTEDEKLSDKQVRQNLAYAIEKGDLPGERSIGPLSPNSWGYNPQVKPYDRDLSKAKDLKDTKIILSTLPNLLKTAEKIKKDWEEVGILCEIEVVSEIPESYQAFLATVDIPKDPDQYSLWHSTQTSTNISHFKNARIDKLLEDGRTELDQETRKKIYLDFQRFLVEEVPAIFLYHPEYYTIKRK